MTKSRCQIIALRQQHGSAQSRLINSIFAAWLQWAVTQSGCASYARFCSDFAVR